jgi:putative phosphoesterase
MKIGLMADSHDRLDAIEDAIDFFNSEGVEHVLHAGDVISPFTSAKFCDLKAKLYVVWGNNDGDRELLKKKFGEIGAYALGEVGVIELAGRRIILLHGTSQAVVDAIEASGMYDLLVRGHTHSASVKEGRTLVVNPGEVCGYLTGRKTVAIFEPEKMRAEIFEI